MKRSTAIILIVLSFILGALFHLFYGNYRLEENRVARESYYQSIFRRGSVFEEITGLQVEGLSWKYDPEKRRYDAVLPPTFPRLKLRIEVNEQKKIQKVSVVTSILE